MVTVRQGRVTAAGTMLTVLAGGLWHCNGNITTFDLPGLASNGVMVDPRAKDASPDTGPRAAGQCPPPTEIQLDGLDAAKKTSAGGVEVYRFTQPSKAGVFLRVYNDEAAPTLRVTQTCDLRASDSAIVPRTLLGGAMLHGELDAGAWFFIVDWHGNEPAKGYKLNGSRFTTASSCQSAISWTALETKQTADVAAATDATSGCTQPDELGNVYFGVGFGSAVEQWSFTVTPKGPWRAKLQALGACAAGACVASAQASSAAGQPATLIVKGVTSVVIGVGAVDPLETGTFDLAAAQLANCSAEGAACGSNGVCCSGKCQPATTDNACGTRCATSCANDPHGTASCNGKSCVVTCAGTYSQCSADPASACRYKVNGGDTAHCGSACTDCSLPPNVENASGWQCAAGGTCQPVCIDGTCNNGGACLSTSSDPQNCGGCGNDCVKQNAPLAADRHYDCNTGVCAPKCNGNACRDNQDQCVPWDINRCGDACRSCATDVWRGTVMCGPDGLCCNSTQFPRCSDSYFN